MFAPLIGRGRAAEESRSPCVDKDSASAGKTLKDFFPTSQGNAGPARVDSLKEQCVPPRRMHRLQSQSTQASSDSEHSARCDSGGEFEISPRMTSMSTLASMATLTSEDRPTSMGWENEELFAMNEACMQTGLEPLPSESPEHPGRLLEKLALPGCIQSDLSVDFEDNGRSLGIVPTCSSRRCPSPGLASTTSSKCSELFDSPGETVILLDWDNTLCPTASCNHLLRGIEPSKKETALLSALEDAVSDFLSVAAELGCTTIVTMARDGWVDTCAGKLMPRVTTKLKELGIKVVSARESIPQRIMRCAYADDRDPSQYLKTRAMESVVKKVYTSKGGVRAVLGAAKQRSWKNIVSIGDSSAERFALQDLVFRRTQRNRSGDWQTCRCKTILLMDKPSLEHQCKQIEVMSKLLPCIVRQDGDLDLQVVAEDLALDNEFLSQ